MIGRTSQAMCHGMLGEQGLAEPATREGPEREWRTTSGCSTVMPVDFTDEALWPERAPNAHERSKAQSDASDKTHT